MKTLVRDPEKLGVFKDQVESIQGDAYQVEKLEETIAGTEAVISTLPPVMNGNQPAQSAQLMEELVAALERNSVKR